MFKKLLAAMAALLLGASLLAAAPLVLNDTGGKVIKIDGSLSDWPANALHLQLNRKDQVANGNQLWTGPDFLSADVYVTYDSRYLYVSAKVNTPAPLQNEHQGGETYKGDGVDLYFSFDGSQPGHDAYGDQDIQFGFPARPVPGYVWCYTRNEKATGGLCATQKTADGYTLEGAIPLSYFWGATIKPGQPILVEAGVDSIGVPGGKDRTVQISYSGDPEAYHSAAKWTAGVLAGKPVAKIPESKGDDIGDGTRGLPASSVGSIAGLVVDDLNRPIPGAMIATWPRSKDAKTGPDGRFHMDSIKLWGHSVVTARKPGYYSSLARAARGGSAKIRLQKIPDYSAKLPPTLFGHNFWMWMPKWGNPIKGTEGLVKPWHLGSLRFGGHNNETDDATARTVGLDAFIAYCRAIGAEPYVQVSILRMDSPKGKVLADPSWSAELVREANLVKHYNIKYWSVGNEGDLYDDTKDWPGFDAKENARQVREHIIAMKLVDPSILVSGGELSWRYEEGANDWVRPIMRYNYDTLNFFAVHTYGFAKEEDQTVDAVTKKSDDFTKLYLRIKSKVDRSTDTTVPLIVTEQNVGATGEPNNEQGEAGPLSFWCGYWMANIYGQGERLRIPFIMPWSIKEDWTLGAIGPNGPKPHYYGVLLASGYAQDVPVDNAVSGNPNLRFYATRSSKDGTISCLVLNPTKQMQQATHKVGARVITHAYYPESISVCYIPKGGARVDYLVYTRPMADVGKPPAWNPTVAEAVNIVMPTPTPLGPAKLTLIDDFESGGMSSAAGCYWWAGCDSNGLGTTMSPMPYQMTAGGSPKSPKYAAHIYGHLGSNKAPWPFVALNVNTSPQSKATDLSQYKGIQFMVKGDGGKYSVQIERDAVTDYAHFTASYRAPKDWTIVRIPWDKFTQPSWGKKVDPGVKDVLKISFHPQVNDKDYDLWLDDLNYWQ